MHAGSVACVISKAVNHHFQLDLPLGKVMHMLISLIGMGDNKSVAVDVKPESYGHSYGSSGGQSAAYISILVTAAE